MHDNLPQRDFLSAGPGLVERDLVERTTIAESVRVLSVVWSLRMEGRATTARTMPRLADPALLSQAVHDRPKGTTVNYSDFAPMMFQGRALTLGVQGPGASINDVPSAEDDVAISVVLAQLCDWVFFTSPGSSGRT